MQGRFEEIGRRARRVQEAVDRVRGGARVGGVRIEVAADGRITELELPDPAVAHAVLFAHEKALRQARERAGELRRELTDDPAVAEAMRRFLAAEGAAGDRVGATAGDQAGAAIGDRAGSQDRAGSAAARPVTDPGEDPGYENPYALPPEVRRRLGM
ncbi:hypothetical protein [Nocardia sp. NPDC127526]|uniref:hypothetical protein n=1 Tax=Nocardia sp. NPDC127526 TaxID=3345393 RepID=UPI003637B31C